MSAGTGGQVALADLAYSKGEAFETDRWHWQLKMMDAMITGLERSLAGFT